MIESEIRTRAAVSASGWTGHWGLRFDPFLASSTPYVPLASHEEAIARLSHLIDSEQSPGLLDGESGSGKSVLLGRVGRILRSPARRFVRVANPMHGEDLVSSLTGSLGMPGDGKSLRAALRVLGWQQIHLVVLVDECRALVEGSGASELKRLADSGVNGGPRLTLILATRDEGVVREYPEFRDALPARLKRLTRTECETYVGEKLRAAGRVEEAFTPKALTRIHAAGEGIPRSFDRLASLCLMAGARQGLEMIGPDLVDAIGRELSPFPL